MLKNRLAQLIFRVTRIPLSWAAVKAKLMPSEIINYCFEVKINSDLLAEIKLSGSFSYNTLAIKGKGFETIRLKDGFRLNFNFLETLYTETDDVASRNPNAPFVNLFNGQIMGLYYVVRSPAGASFSIFEHDFNSSELGQGSVSYTRSVLSLTNTQSTPKTVTINDSLVARK